MMGDLNALVATLPIPKEGADHGSMALKLAVKGAADRISKSYFLCQRRDMGD